MSKLYVFKISKYKFTSSLVKVIKVETRTLKSLTVFLEKGDGVRDPSVVR